MLTLYVVHKYQPSSTGRKNSLHFSNHNIGKEDSENMASTLKSLALVAMLGAASGVSAQSSASGSTTRYWDCCKPRYVADIMYPFSRNQTDMLMHLQLRLAGKGRRHNTGDDLRHSRLPHLGPHGCLWLRRGRRGVHVLEPGSLGR